ncbi:bacterio-opsin activator HTH domain-containing protein [Natrialba hulunbeirensis JCM 10989]|uniref:Bacterio-opsin activator HTH domain-containing protein n=1 Tax=Natrialba hulunbeirensis JCM 10989 TaxID=1227493 RepID=M0A513_9EURY|nr:bacterio-opsin activator HTH domain-containing protein [Natrialba hulunbeirensis JCM 10989]
MAIEASFVATQGTFPLAEVFSKFPAAQIELDRVVPATGVLIPYFWLQDIDSAAINLEGISHPGIDDLRIIDDVDGELFVRIDWDFDYESILSAILETDVALVSAIGREDKWTFEIRGESQADVSVFQTYCRNNDISVELTELHALSPLHSGQEYDLTEAQREALTLAYARLLRFTAPIEPAGDRCRARYYETGARFAAAARDEATDREHAGPTVRVAHKGITQAKVRTTRLPPLY